MIARLTGLLAEADLTEVIIDVNGVGYAVSVPLSTYDKLPGVNEKVTLYTHFQMREDGIQLFGFATTTERDLFRLLVDKVQGVGPRLALNVLSCISIDNFVTAIANGDTKALGKINGIGKRTAERMVVELKDSIDGIGKGVIGSAVAVKEANGKTVKAEVLDAVAALEALGYKHDAAEKAVSAIWENNKDASTEQLLRKALGALNN